VQQLLALVGLRWQMVRNRHVRVQMLLLGLVVLGFLALVVVAGRSLPERRAFDASLVTPTAFLVYAGLAVAGPLAAGGGVELFPPDQLSPFPVRPATSFLGALLLAPLNLAWIAETASLLALTSYVAGSWAGVPAAMMVTIAFVIAATVLGQALAWWLGALRQVRWGRYLLWTLVASVAAAIFVAVRVGLPKVADHSPAKPVVYALLDGSAGRYEQSAWAIVGLLVLAGIGIVLGVRAAAFERRHPQRVIGALTRVRRRESRRSHRAQLRALERAGVWRTGSLRRGLLVMALLPGAAAAAAEAKWAALSVIAGLVPAGAGLLYGVNAFCLEAGGALWLGSTPLRPREHLLAKGWVLAEVCLCVALLTALAGAARAQGSPSAVDVTAILATVVACTATVVSTCLHVSIRNPHRALLTGRRDTPAPPGSMAVYSARLAATTTLLAIAITGAAASEVWWVPPALASAVVVLAVLSVQRTARFFTNPAIRANVLMTVSNG
jgi:hypothetical protein